MDDLTKQQAKVVMDRVHEFVTTLSEKDMRDLDSGAKHVTVSPAGAPGKVR